MAMRAEDAREYLVESNEKFVNMLQSLAAEHAQLCAYTQTMARELAVNDDGLQDGFVFDIKKLEPHATWLHGTQRDVEPPLLKTQPFLSSVPAPVAPVCPDEVVSAEAPPGAVRFSFTIDEHVTYSKSNMSTKSNYVEISGDSQLYHDSAPARKMHIHDDDESSMGGHSMGKRSSTPLSLHQSTPSQYNSDGTIVAAEHYCSANANSTRSTTDTTFVNIHPSILHRLQARLGILDCHGMITPMQLYAAVQSLGLEKYNKKDIRRLIDCMRVALGLTETEEDEDDDALHDSTSQAGVHRFLGRFGSKEIFRAAVGMGRISNKHSETATFGKPIRFKDFAGFLVSQRCRLGADNDEMLCVLREVLLSGDANRLVAELTSVRVDDLAAPLPSLDWDTIFEPMVGVMILANGLTIGLQTDARSEDWPGWFWLEVWFSTFFSIELIFRCRHHGLVAFFTGHDRYWAYVDIVVVVLAIFDLILQICNSNFSVGALTVVRTARLTRITRLFRIFRLGFLRELNIMVKGLFAGCKTLFWAIVLLFFTIYVMGILAVYTIGKHPGNVLIAREELFTTVPRAMLTCFRCFVGDCTTSEGHALVKLLSDAHGLSFIAAYLFSFTLVTLGLFNLIMALYVETTMAFAKRTEEKDKRRRERESLRVAHITKKLLKKFIVAQRLWNDPRDIAVKEIVNQIQHSENHDMESDMTISKELFLLMVQDQEVQRLMNELDIPPDRANLFDVLDADGTGDLHVTELVHGLLKIRGEARKSDIIASFLAVRALQEMVRLMEHRLLTNQKRIMNELGLETKQHTRNVSIWDPHARQQVSVYSSQASSHRSPTSLNASVITQQSGPAYISNAC